LTMMNVVCMLIPRATGPPFFNEMHSNRIPVRSFLKAWTVQDDDLRAPEFAEDVLGVFASVLPLHIML